MDDLVREDIAPEGVDLDEDKKAAMEEMVRYRIAICCFFNLFSFFFLLTIYFRSTDPRKDLLSSSAFADLLSPVDPNGGRPTSAAATVRHSLVGDYERLLNPSVLVVLSWTLSLLW